MSMIITIKIVVFVTHSNTRHIQILSDSDTSHVVFLSAVGSGEVIVLDYHKFNLSRKNILPT